MHVSLRFQKYLFDTEGYLIYRVFHALSELNLFYVTSIGIPVCESCYDSAFIAKIIYSNYDLIKVT